MFQMPASQIGGAIVRRTFSCGDRQLRNGERLSAEQVLAMPISNRNALVDKKYMDLFPKGGDASGAAASGERFVISMGFGKYMVIEGRKITDGPIDREQAYALAGKAVPPEKAAKAGRAKQ